MPVIILCLFRFVRLLGSGHQAIVVEKLALRLQLAAFKRKRKRPVLTQWDRLFWIGMSRPCSSWRDSVLFVQPDTVVRWQRERFLAVQPCMSGVYYKIGLAHELFSCILRSIWMTGKSYVLHKVWSPNG